jgi:hypothetical protein
MATAWERPAPDSVRTETNSDGDEGFVLPSARAAVVIVRRPDVAKNSAQKELRSTRRGPDLTLFMQRGH